MLAIRFNRTGKRNQAHFRVVLQEHTKAPGKRHIEILGSYDPHKKTTILKKERILYWIGQGAQVSPVVSNLLVREGVIEAKKIAKRMPRPVVKESIVEETPAAAAPEASVDEAAPEAPVTEAVVAETPVEVPTEAVAEIVTETKEETPLAAEKAEAPVEAETKA
ncbi:MAG: 30S ribosomal protein S16 [Candidatus Moraniibacteriota bacterium]